MLSKVHRFLPPVNHLVVVQSHHAKRFRHVRTPMPPMRPSDALNFPFPSHPRESLDTWRIPRHWPNLIQSAPQLGPTARHNFPRTRPLDSRDGMIKMGPERQLFQGGRSRNINDGLIEMGPEPELLHESWPSNAHDGLIEGSPRAMATAGRSAIQFPRQADSIRHRTTAAARRPAKLPQRLTKSIPER